MSEDNDIAGPSVEKEFEFVDGLNNNKILVRGSYRHYQYYKLKDGTEVWRCSSHGTTCRAIITILGRKILHEDLHTCSPIKKPSIIEEFKRECENKVIMDHTPIPQIYKNVKKSYVDKGYNLLEEIPSFISVKSGLYRLRNASFDVTKTQFADTKDVEIPACFADFLLLDINQEKRIPIFSLSNAQRTIQERKVFFFDGTFKSCASPFYQLYSMHADIGSNDEETNIIPVLFALLPDKTQRTYEILFQSIKQGLPDWHPSKILLDFEQGAINAIQKKLPNVTVKGCNFHFKQALVRKSKDLDISTRQDKDHVARCAALAHLPISDVEDGWLAIMETSPANEKITKFNNYFVDSWLNNANLPYKIWNCEGERHRTTNLVESWHKRLNGELKKKPRLIEMLFKIREHAEYYEKYHCPTKNRDRKTVNKDLKIQIIDKKYRQKSITIYEALNLYKSVCR